MDRKGFLVSSAVTYLGTGLSVLLMAAFYGLSLRIGTESFGALQSALGLMFLLYAGRGAVASYTVIHAADGGPSLGTAVRRILALGGLLGAGTTALFALAAPFARDFLHFDSALPFLLIGLSAIPSTFGGIVEGILNVQRRFGALAISSTMLPVGNVVLAFLLFRDGFQEADAGWIALGAQLFNCINALFVDWSFLRSADRPAKDGSAIREVATLLVTSLLFGLSLRMDVLWARHVLTENASGTYAVAASIALVLNLVAGGAGRVASVSLRGGGGKRIVGLSYAVICAIALTLASCFLLAGDPLLSLITGRRIETDWTVLGPLFASLAFFTIINFDYTCLNVVTKRIHAGLALVLVAVQGIALVTLGVSPAAIAWTQCAVMGGLMAAFSALLWNALSKHASAPAPHPAEHHLTPTA